jgi:hypothetical protein
MARVLSALSLFLVSFAALAEIAPEPPAQGNTMGFILFGVLFLVMCVGFVWLVIWNDKKQKAKEGKK